LFAFDMERHLMSFCTVNFFTYHFFHVFGALCYPKNDSENLVFPTPYVPPSKKGYEILFQPLFDEYFNPLPRAVSPDPVAVATPRVVDPVGSPSSTIIDQDVPSASTSPTNQEIQFHVTH
nr:hypothetical protein [Tanacetum cinerariifolium]